MATNYYVTMTDKFMSGWGMAEGKINKLVIKCDDMTQAIAISKAAKCRNEMKYINISINKPLYNKRIYFVSEKSFSDMGGPWLDYYKK